ncbi:uncharacterized protein [Henckelia pumila]
MEIGLATQCSSTISDAGGRILPTKKVKRKSASGLKIKNNSTTISSVHVNHIFNKPDHVIVKGGKNFVTVAGLRASLTDQEKKNTSIFIKSCKGEECLFINESIH